ncbi:MAG: hypothetical protein AAF845_05200 [Bacteroidota bacterium]
MSAYRTPLLLAALALVLGGAGVYATDVHQQGRIDTLRASREGAEAATARVEDLTAQEAVAADAVTATLSRWNSRYKFIPREMDKNDVYGYLESLTREGFESFDVNIADPTLSGGVGAYAAEVRGEGTYAALYHLIWHLENNRALYRVSDLEMAHVEFATASGGLLDLVTFRFTIHAYVSDLDGIRAPEAGLAPIPVGLLPSHQTDADIFRPLVRASRDAPATEIATPDVAVAEAPAPPPAPPVQAPPAPRLYERATLRGIIGGSAIFDLDGTQVRGQVGDEVLGGEITSLDAQNGVAELTVVEDGRERTVTFRLGALPRF